MLPSRSTISTISARPFAKESRLRKVGNCSRRKISFAEARSGLIIMLSPSSSRRKKSCSTYSGLRIRAIVCLQPSLRAMMQQSRFSSSPDAAAISRSLFCTSAAFCTRRLAPLPCTAMTSKISADSRSTWRLLSITTMSCPSLDRRSVSVHPTFPSPTMTIFIFPFRPYAEIPAAVTAAGTPSL